MGSSAIREAYLEVREAARRESDILGLVLTGSRGRGFENECSDYDFALFVPDASLEKYRARFAHMPAGAHMYLFTPDSFKARAAWGSERAWERYTWAHLTVDFDRSAGEIQRLLDEKSRVPAEHAFHWTHGSLNHFLNQVYHSFKNLRAGNEVGYRLEAVEGIGPYMQALFGIHDRRLHPYYKYLRWELENYPLAKLTLSNEELVGCLLRILENGDYRAQQTLLQEAIRIFPKKGYDDLWDSYRCRLALAYPEPVPWDS